MKKLTLIIILILIVLVSGCEKQTKSEIYSSDIIKIKSELINKGYDVVDVNFQKNPHGNYVVTVLINSKGNYDKEALDMHRAMFNNAIADFYFASISDYELQTAWGFTADRKTLNDYFSGRINEQDYIHQVKKEKLI